MAYYKRQRQDKVVALFAAANPALTDRLKLDEEIREIMQKIELATHREMLALTSIWAVRPNDLLQFMDKYKPQIVHFSSHGVNSTGEIILVDDGGLPRPMSSHDIKMLFTVLRDNVRVVILNACYTKSQARAIVDVIDCAIGMNNEIEGRAATAFSAWFYRAIASGRSVQDAFNQGKLALQFTKIPQESVPELHVREGVDASKVFLITPEENLASQEASNLLIRGKNDLLHKDYDSAIRDLGRAIDVFSEIDSSKGVARAKYFLALAQLRGKRPFIQTKSGMDLVEGLLRSAIDLHRSYAYIFTLAIFKVDFARNGLRHLMGEAQRMLVEVNTINCTIEDKENIDVLCFCQPDLIRDYGKL